MKPLKPENPTLSFQFDMEGHSMGVEELVLAMMVAQVGIEISRESCM